MYTVVAPVPGNLAAALQPYRQRYDPTAKLIPPNLAIIKPFRFSGTRQELHAHLNDVGDLEAPIRISLAGWDVYSSKGYLLCLPVIAGQQEFLALRSHLLTGPLSPLAEQSQFYRPHIVFGRMPTKEDVNNARNVLARFEPQFIFRVTHIELWQRKSRKDLWKLEKRFGLKGTVLSTPQTGTPAKSGNEVFR